MRRRVKVKSSVHSNTTCIYIGKQISMKFSRNYFKKWFFTGQLFDMLI